MERRNEHVAMSARDRTSTAVSLTVTLTCAVAVAVLGIVLYPLQIDTSMGSFEARDLPMATMNDAFKQAEVVFVKLEQGQLGEVPSTTTPGGISNDTSGLGAEMLLPREVRAALERQSYWRWAVTLIYEDKTGRGILTPRHLLKVTAPRTCPNAALRHRPASFGSRGRSTA